MAENITGEYITVIQTGAGLCAAHIVEIEDDKIGKYTDVQQTGFGRYKPKDRRKAVAEARSWAMTEGLVYRP